MSSFFDEISEFFSQFVVNSNYFDDVSQNFLFLFHDAIEWTMNFSHDLPPTFSWVIPLVMLATIFEFIRGR